MKIYKNSFYQKGFLFFSNSERDNIRNLRFSPINIVVFPRRDVIFIIF